jgi:hypothetical protein
MRPRDESPLQCPCQQENAVFSGFLLTESRMTCAVARVKRAKNAQRQQWRISRMKADSALANAQVSRHRFRPVSARLAQW